MNLYWLEIFIGYMFAVYTVQIYLKIEHDKVPKAEPSVNKMILR